MHIRITILLLVGCFFAANLFAQKEGRYVREGNKAYKNNDFDQAESAYRKGVEENAYSYEANFNLGNALYEKGEFESASSQYDLLRQPNLDKNQLAKVYHNLGNSFLKQENYQEAVQAFKEALRNNPSDADTRYNLVYAMKKLQEQQNNQDQQDQDQQNEDQQDQDQQNQDQENQDQQNQDQENQDQENQDQQNQEQEGQNQEQQNQEQEGQNQEEQKQQQGQEGQENKSKDQLSRAEAERILQALQLDEQQLHNKNKKKGKTKKVRIVKDW